MKWVLRVLVVLVILGLAVGGWIWHAGYSGEGAGSAAAVGGTELSDPALVAKGSYLAAIGDCAACHTMQGGEPFAGGRYLATPFGNIPSPNITPDRATGLGDWSFEQFWGALHSGKGRHGELLYPVFSYTSYTKVTREDALAIFAYLRTIPAVHRPDSSSGLGFPYNVRSSLAAWRAMYFKEGVYRPDASRSPAWNRGAYLVQGLGHCNECHVARTALGGMATPSLSGGQIPVQNWYAPDLSTQANGGLDGWTAKDIVDLLKTGQSARGSTFGPMSEVVARSTQHMSDEDLTAIATYLQSLPARPAEKAAGPSIDREALVDQGAGIYKQQCAGCHGGDGKGVAGIYPPLDGNSSVIEPTGINAIRVVLLGGFPPVTAGNPRPYSMPPFAQQLGDREVAAVVSYVRQAWSNQAAPVQVRDVGTYRQTPID